MKYLKQFSIIITISFIGELLHHYIPLPIPASIYGIVFLFLALLFKIIKPEQIKDSSNFLIEIMPIMFVPAVVGLMDIFNDIKNKIIIYLLIIMISNILVFMISGLLCQLVIKDKENDNE